MRKVRSDIFDRFKCIADKCPKTCCSGWQIMVDEDSLEKYKKYRGPIRQNLVNSIDWEDSCFLQSENGDCAFLNENGLCDLISAEGDGMLCDTCRLYPRHVEEYEDLREWCMSLSCPEIVRLLVEKEDSLEFEITDDDSDDPLEDEFEDFDVISFSKLQDSRDAMFKVLRNSEISISARMGLVLKMAEDVQRAYDEDEIFTVDDIIEEYLNPDTLKENAEEFEISFSGFVRDDFDILNELEVLSDDWEEVLDSIDAYPFSKGDSYTGFIEGMSEEQHERVLENLLVSLLYTYYLGSIYNGMIYGYTQMCIFSVIMMDAFALCKSEKEGKKISKEEYESFIYRFSRETEHSNDNIFAMLEYFDLKE